MLRREQSLLFKEMRGFIFTHTTPTGKKFIGQLKGLKQGGHLAKNVPHGNWLLERLVNIPFCDLISSNKNRIS